MKKGQWLRNSLHLFARKKLSFGDVYNLVLARYAKKPTSFRFSGVFFSHVDHAFWSAIADIFVNDVYETRYLDIQANHTIIDIGAHRGGFVAYIASTSNASVIAYEPHPENYHFLIELINENQFKNITTHKKAIGRETKKGQLLISSASSRHKISNNTDAQEANYETIEILSLDDALHDIDAVYLLKMDCEGAESEILLQASENTITKIKSLAIETHLPITVPEMQQLQAKLTLHFSNIKFIDQEQDNLGFLFAWN